MGTDLALLSGALLRAENILFTHQMFHAHVVNSPSSACAALGELIPKVLGFIEVFVDEGCLVNPHKPNAEQRDDNTTLRGLEPAHKHPLGPCVGKGCVCEQSMSIIKFLSFEFSRLLTLEASKELYVPMAAKRIWETGLGSSERITAGKQRGFQALPLAVNSDLYFIKINVILVG